jgi:hypothetical protein
MVLQINRAKKDYWLKHWAALLMAAAFMALVFSGLSQAETLEQRTFASPEEAVKALVGALKSNDVNALEAIFGPGSEDLVSSGDPVWDSVEYERTIKRYEEKNWLEETDGNVVLYIGKEDWPFAIPIVKKDVLWHFDTEQGREEILARRIGKNELSTIQACLAYVDAQREYALKDRDNNAFLEYARQFISDPGKKNGLYWDVKEGEQRSPLGQREGKACRDAGSHGVGGHLRRGGLRRGEENGSEDGCGADATAGGGRGRCRSKRRSRLPGVCGQHGRAGERHDSGPGAGLSDQAELQEGSFVKKGTLLFEIDPRPFRPRWTWPRPFLPGIRPCTGPPRLRSTGFCRWPRPGR